MSKLFTNASQASNYMSFRPTYPDSLYHKILKHCDHKGLAIDVACGTGQATFQLAKSFERVIALDTSKEQLDNLKKQIQNTSGISSNVSVGQLGAEDFTPEMLNIKPNSVDLVTVAQGLHWFNFTTFYKNAKQVLKKPDGVIACWCYTLPKFVNNQKLDSIKDYYYGSILGDKYWDPRRKLVENGYRDIPWPFESFKNDGGSDGYDDVISVKWNVNQCIGYLQSWSATQTYINNTKNGQSEMEGSTSGVCYDNFEATTLISHLIEQRQYSPLVQIEKDIAENWPGLSTDNPKGDAIDVIVPVYLLLGKAGQ